MGPLRDVGRQAGGPLLAALDGDSREAVLDAALDALAAAAVIVIEDIHWADDGTLDLVALLGRRLVRSPGCLLLTSRSEGVAERPEVRRVLAGLPRECAVRVSPEPLSQDAVALLAARAGRDASDLHAVSGGNPFYVTEVLAAAADGGVPASVRDAVALRVTGISASARAVVELAAVVPGATELWLFGETVGADAAAIDECIAAGLLTVRGDAVAYRHDLARRAVEDGSRPSAAASSTASSWAPSPPTRTPIPRAWPTTPAARATSWPSAASRPSPPGPRRARAATGRRSSTGRRRSRPRRAPIPPAAWRRSRASRSRATSAGTSSAPPRRAAPCSRSTRRRATRCASATTCAGCRA